MSREQLDTGHGGSTDSTVIGQCYNQGSFSPFLLPFLPFESWLNCLPFYGPILGRVPLPHHTCPLWDQPLWRELLTQGSQPPSSEDTCGPSHLDTDTRVPVCVGATLHRGWPWWQQRYMKGEQPQLCHLDPEMAASSREPWREVLDWKQEAS